MRLIQSFLAAAILSTLGATALAQEEVPESTVDARLSATFRDPVGTVSATDSIEVWVTLKAIGTDAVRFDLSDSEPFGLQPSQLPTKGFDPMEQGPPTPVLFGTYDRISLYFFRSCNDTFTVSCSGGAYSFDANVGVNSWFNVGSPFDLASGASMDIHLYTLTPVGGAAAPGTYQAFNMGVALAVHGLAEDGVTALEADVFSATTCDGLPSGCSFTRTVVSAVPEPASVVMLLGGLGVLGAAVARQRKRRSTGAIDG